MRHAVADPWEDPRSIDEQAMSRTMAPNRSDDDGPGEDGNGAPYGGLTPDVVLDALDAVGFRGDGRLIALNSYENRVYQVYMEDGPPIVTKFYRPGRWSDEAIVEEHAFVRELAAAELPVVAPIPGAIDETLHRFASFRFAVYPRRGGRAPELESRETLEWMGRFIGRIHAIGATRIFEHRPALDIATFGEEPRDYLLANDFIPSDLRAAYEAVITLALDGVRRCYDRAGDVHRIRLHGDCHAGNVLWVDDGPDKGPHFVDFDDCRSGPAVQDLWMLLSGDRSTMTTQLADVLAGYEDFHEFAPRELHLTEALRVNKQGKGQQERQGN